MLEEIRYPSSNKRKEILRWDWETRVWNEVLKSQNCWCTVSCTVISNGHLLNYNKQDKQPYTDTFTTKEAGTPTR